MQDVQRRELPERMSWARAVIFAAGFFFVAAILIGQLPGYVYLKMTASTLEGFSQGCFALALTCLGIFAIIQTNVSLFDPKPIIPPAFFTALGSLLTVGGFAFAIWADLNLQFFPTADMSIAPILGGKFLWFQANSIDFVMVGLVAMTVGLAMVFYSRLAARERVNPDRSDPGTTPAVRWMIIIASLLVVLFMVAYMEISDAGLAHRLFPDDPDFGLKVVNLGAAIPLGIAILLGMFAFLLRLHYLMRPIRKKTMAPLYAVGAFGLAHLGLIFLVLAIALYPLLALLHYIPILGPYFTFCGNEAQVPSSCTFSQQAGYLVDAIVTSGFFFLLMGAIWAWKSHRYLVLIGSVVAVAAIAATTLMVHTGPDKVMVSMIFCAGMLILAAIWTAVSRREFAVVGEKNLGCLGQWLIFGTCLFIYLGAFAFFSIAPHSWEPETAPNIPFVAGAIIQAPLAAGATTPELAKGDAVVMLILMGVLALIQFYFLNRNRYKI
ncbi:hypothetical protein [Thermosporothrix hazakensis]|jgi:hypothetical protein|nr:hypothetical protein [Thermosporothrix hazakensis]